MKRPVVCGRFDESTNPKTTKTKWSNNMSAANSSEMAIETLSAVVKLLRKYETRFASRQDFQSSSSCKDHIKRCEETLLSLQSGRSNQKDLRQLYQSCKSAGEFGSLLSKEIGPLEAVVGSDSKNFRKTRPTQALDAQLKCALFLQTCFRNRKMVKPRRCFFASKQQTDKEFRLFNKIKSIISDVIWSVRREFIGSKYDGKAYYSVLDPNKVLTDLLRTADVCSGPPPKDNPDALVFYASLFGNEYRLIYTRDAWHMAVAPYYFEGGGRVSCINVECSVDVSPENLLSIAAKTDKSVFDDLPNRDIWRELFVVECKDLEVSTTNYHRLSSRGGFVITRDLTRTLHHLESLGSTADRVYRTTPL